jgi:hypothetical protein
MLLERTVPGISLAAAFIGASVVVLGQAVFTPGAEAVERIIGGSLLVTAAYLIVRWTFRLLHEARQTAAEDRKLLLDHLDKANQQIAELNTQLHAERSLRVSLEQRGLEDRRRGDE